MSPSLGATVLAFLVTETSTRGTRRLTLAWLLAVLPSASVADVLVTRLVIVLPAVPTFTKALSVRVALPPFVSAPTIHNPVAPL